MAKQEFALKDVRRWASAVKAKEIPLVHSYDVHRFKVENKSGGDVLVTVRGRSPLNSILGDVRTGEAKVTVTVEGASTQQDVEGSIAAVKKQVEEADAADTDDTPTDEELEELDN